MKVLKRKSPVDINQCMETNNNDDCDMTLVEFDSEPLYYKRVILPMLSAGHEGELLNWLVSIGFLKCSQRCDNTVKDICCQGVMYRVPAKTIDTYQWQCVMCTKKRSIRESSAFQDVKCRFNDAMRILCGWCKGVDPDDMAKLLCTKKQCVKSVYKIATDTAEKYIKSNVERWKIGGPGIVVIVDTYSEGLSKLNIEESHRVTNYTKPILCLAEVKEIPTKFWVQLLDRYSSRSSKTILNNVNELALKIIENVVIPGSIIVTNLNTRICNYETLQSLKHLYPVIVSVEGLERHNTINELIENLETIWKPCLEMCRQAYCLASNSSINDFFTSILWMEQFGNESLETLLNQMCYNNSF